MISYEQKIGRWSELNSKPEITNLEYGMDFRNPEYRREVFLRFYEFHLKYSSHPGGVYIAMPWLSRYYNLSREDKLWVSFINGCSQNIVTTWLIWSKFPSLSQLDLDKLDSWWNEVLGKFKAGFGWDSDRKYFKIGKTGFPACVASYKDQVDKFGSQENLFNELMNGTPYDNFKNTWDFVRDKFLSFGRLSTFSYLEYLKIQGENLDCDSLFLDDINGSKSHRNGLCKVLGRDDLDWWDAKDSENKDFPGYKKETIEWLSEEVEQLMADARERINSPDIGYFTLESTLCCYKSWHRPNRRYPNVYMDMFHDRIRYAEKEWGNKFDIFWRMREEKLPKNLRLECNPNDPGVSKEKQNHYLLTGQPIMMNQEFGCFKNDFNDKIDNEIGLENYW